jgi:hypothetical protein
MIFRPNPLRHEWRQAYAWLPCRILCAEGFVTVWLEYYRYRYSEEGCKEVELADGTEGRVFGDYS